MIWVQTQVKEKRNINLTATTNMNGFKKKKKLSKIYSTLINI